MNIILLNFALLTGCNVRPECYGHMTKLLTTVGEGRVIVALEGGYNLTSISYCMAMCAKALLGDPVPPLSGCLQPCQSAMDSLTSVINVHSKFWSSLNFKVICFERIELSLELLSCRYREEVKVNLLNKVMSFVRATTLFETHLHFIL